MAKGIIIFTLVLLVAVWTFAQDEPEPIAPFVPETFGGFMLTPQPTVTSPIPTGYIATQLMFPTRTPTKPPSILPPVNNSVTMNENERRNDGNLTNSILWTIRRMARLLP